MIRCKLRLLYFPDSAFHLPIWKGANRVKHYTNLTTIIGHWTWSFISVLDGPHRAIKTSFLAGSLLPPPPRGPLHYPDPTGSTVWLVLHCLWLHPRSVSGLLHLTPQCQYSWTGFASTQHIKVFVYLQNRKRVCPRPYDQDDEGRARVAWSIYFLCSVEYRWCFPPCLPLLVGGCAVGSRPEGL